MPEKKGVHSRVRAVAFLRRKAGTAFSVQEGKSSCPVPWSFWISIVCLNPFTVFCVRIPADAMCPLSLDTAGSTPFSHSSQVTHSTCSVLSCHISRGPGGKPVVHSN